MGGGCHSEKPSASCCREFRRFYPSSNASSSQVNLACASKTASCSNRIHSFPRSLDEHLRGLDTIIHRAHPVPTIVPGLSVNPVTAVWSSQHIDRNLQLPNASSRLRNRLVGVAGNSVLKLPWLVSLFGLTLRFLVAPHLYALTQRSTGGLGPRNTCNHPSGTSIQCGIPCQSITLCDL